MMIVIGSMVVGLISGMWLWDRICLIEPIKGVMS